jgi:pyruvate, water dikinase
MNIIKFENCSYKNKHLVGGKNASLGELYHLSQQLNFNIADGFAISILLYDEFIKQNNLNEIIETTIAQLDCNNIKSLKLSSEKLINAVTEGDFTDSQEENIQKYYDDLCKKYNKSNIEVAVRSSALCEDLADASFAGQQDTYLNIIGLNNIICSIKKCFASLFNSCALSYRNTHNININDVKISVAIQKMVRSDVGSAGVAFSMDPTTGYDKAIVINSSFGLGELVVSGGVKPDEIICDKETLRFVDKDPIIMKKKGDKNTKIVFNNMLLNNDNEDHERANGTMEIETSLIEKINFSITNSQSVNLARCVLLLEEKYCEIFNKKIGIDVEWGIDGLDRKLYILQTRPETVHSNKDNLKIEKYILDEKSDVLISGVAVGEKISSGKIKLLKSLDEYDKFEKGDILVTEMTTPDWEPIMKISSGIITNKGGNTCHAAIVAREMGLNAIVGTGNATQLLKNISSCTMNCSEGETGHVHDGELKYHIDSFKMTGGKELPIKLMMNIGNPEVSFTSSMLPNSGVGLVRLEFIINNYIQVHPNALINYPNLPVDIKDKIYNILGDSDNAEWYFIKRLARGVAQIASAFKPHDVIVRFSDFKSNEYKGLLGGEIYEPDEENPLIGFRGSVRYYSDEYKHAFGLECKAIKYLRDVMGMTNVIVMLPFTRTTEECKKVLDVMAKNGLVRGENKLQIYLMCEIPSNVIEADEFSPYIDGVSIGSNDLLMLTLGIDRDSEKVAHLSDHTNLSYRRLLRQAIQQYKKNGKKVGLCGQTASDSIEFCEFLIDCGIDSVSVVPNSVIKTINNLKSLDNGIK